MLDNSPFLANIFNGGMIVLGVQLITVSFFNVFYNDIRNRLLGFFTLIAGLVYFYTALIDKVGNIYFIKFLFVGPNEILQAVILYLYIALLGNPNQKIIKHFVFPAIYLLFYKLLYLFFNDVYNTHISSLGIIHYFLAPFYFGFYFYLGIKTFKVTLNDTLKIKARKKFKIFFYSINLKNILCSLLIFVPITMMFLGADFDKDFIKNLFNYLGSWYNFFGLIINQFLILYVLSESKRFKTFFLTVNVFENNQVELDNELISNKINLLFDDKKAFLNPNFNIDLASEEIGESSKVISIYIQKTHGVSFKEYLSKLRIREFKSLLLKDKEAKYDLFGMATKAGFKSKASFYRLFNKFEGITPGAFRKKISKN